MVCRTATANTETDSLTTDTRTEIASTIELSVLKPGSRVVVCTAGGDVYEVRLCGWSIFGDRWIMASPDALLLICGIAGCHWKANISKGG